MSKFAKILISMVFLSISSVGLAAMDGGKHDLSATEHGLGTTVDLCIYCHTPHNALVNVPLWDRKDPTSTFLPYVNPDTLQGTADVAGISKMCMSCHDGVTAYNAVGGSDGDAATYKMLPADAGYVGLDLKDDHPVGVLMSADSDINTVATTLLPQPGGKVECSSCHDVHDNTADAKMLRITGGTLCQTCHNK